MIYKADGIRNELLQDHWLASDEATTFLLIVVIILGIWAHLDRVQH